jgi:hypothetical protein
LKLLNTRILAYSISGRLETLVLLPSQKFARKSFAIIYDIELIIIGMAVRLSSRVSLLIYKNISRLKMADFWAIAQCCLVEVRRRFRGAYCLHHQDSSSGKQT